MGKGRGGDPGDERTSSRDSLPMSMLFPRSCRAGDPWGAVVGGDGPTGAWASGRSDCRGELGLGFSGLLLELCISPASNILARAARTSLLPRLWPILAWPLEADVKLLPLRSEL